MQFMAQRQLFKIDFLICFSASCLCLHLADNLSWKPMVHLVAQKQLLKESK